MRRWMVAGAAALLMQMSVTAPDFWDKKPYTEWSKDQCLKVLHDSPWAKTFTISTVKQDRFGQPTKGESRQTEQSIFYYAQLRSALPVRQAVVRLAQIENHYDKMKEADKKAFDASATRYLDSTYPEIILHVDYASDVDFYDKELANHWQSRQPKEMINSDVYLTTSNGKRIPPTDFKVERGAARAFEFIFPREIDGVPVVAANLETFRFEFPNPQVRDLNDTRTTFEFRMDKMKYKGQLVF